MGTDSNSENEEASFVEFRRKVRSAEVLSSAMERLLRSLQFSGRVSMVVQKRAGVEIRIRGRLLPPARSRLTLAAREEAGGP